MDKKRELHTKEFMIHFSDIEKYEIEEICPTAAIYVMDTESCFKHDNGNIPPKIMNEKGKKIKNKEFNFEVHVYAWAISNNENDYVIYGERIDDMFLTFDNISKKRIELLKPPTTENSVKKYKDAMKFKVFVHNLAWDIEFCKYSLDRLGLKYKLSKIDEKSKKKILEKKINNTFQIIENDNIVYSANINLGNPKILKYTTKEKKTGNKLNKLDIVFTSIEFIDSYKIMSMSLDTIATQVIKIDEMFYKIGSKYDYEKVRLEGHKLTQFEKEYLYNDVYILKEWVNQFYLPLNTKCTTASSISFEAFVNDKFEGEKSKYKAFLEVYPDLTNMSLISQIIKESYKGGWTQTNRKYKGEEIILDNAISIDINSSYPSVVKYKRLPFGTPKLYQGYHQPNENQNNILTILFDGFENKDSDNLIGEIQVGTMSSEEFGLIGTEYIHTNITEEGLKGTNGKSEEYRYKLSLWDFELENILENVIFYTEEKTYDDILEVHYGTGTLNEGYKVESSLCFDMNTGFFADTVDKFTLMKIEGKKSGNSALEAFSKLVLNSFYGKLASNPLRCERDLYFNEDGLAEFKRTEISYLSEKKYFPAFASCVTAHARCNLRKTLYKIGYNNILYFDTDSLYTTITYNEVVEKVGDILHPTELGKWDIEKEYSKFKAIGAKKYMILGKSFGKEEEEKIICKCAGLPADVRKVQTFESFELGATFFGKKVKTKVLGGYVLLEGDYKLSDNGR